MTKAAQRQFLVKVSGPVRFEDYFATKTGGEVAGDVSRAYDGGKKRPDKLGGPSVVGEVVVARPYDPERDQRLIKLLRPYVTRDPNFTVSIQPVDRDLVPVDGVEPDVYTECLVTRVTPPDADASSSEPATFEIAFEPDDVT